MTADSEDLKTSTAAARALGGRSPLQTVREFLNKSEHQRGCLWQPFYGENLCSCGLRAARACADDLEAVIGTMQIQEDEVARVDRERLPEGQDLPQSGNQLNVNDAERPEPEFPSCGKFEPGGSHVAPDYYCRWCGNRAQDHAPDWADRWCKMVQAAAHDERFTDQQFRNMARWVAVDQTLMPRDIAIGQQLSKRIEQREHESRSSDGDEHHKCEDDGVTTGVRDSARCSLSAEASGEGGNLAAEASGTLRSQGRLNDGPALTAEGSTPAGSTPADSLSSKVEQIYDGDWVDPTPQAGHVMVCCDCGLVHSVDFRVEDGRAQFRPYRDEAATQAWRAQHPNLPAQIAVGEPGIAARPHPELWQPIETAPKNQIVLVHDKRGRILAGRWHHGGGWDTWNTEPGTWTLYPTHWMPLPDPPAAAGGIVPDSKK